MAISRGAGTEIIRCASFEYVASETTARDLIIGVQYHIYTVLSVVCFCNATGANLMVHLYGYDVLGGDVTQTMEIFHTSIGTDNVDNSTFVFNDKFSFNGFGPASFTGPMNDATKQDAVADQGGTVQKLRMAKGHAAAQWHVHLTYIDQNNS